MSGATRLAMLRNDLQMLTTSQDDYLLQLIDMADGLIKKEGIVLTEGDIESDGLVAMYAAYLFRKRAGSETAMPRHLRYAMNITLFSQKAGG